MTNRRSSGSSGRQTAIDDDCLLTVREAAAFLHLAPGTIFHLVSQKRLPTIRISSRCIRFSRRALLAWIDSRTQKVEHFPKDQRQSQ